MKKLGVESLSSQSVSNITKELDSEVEAFMKESLEGKEISYIWLDGTYIKVRNEGMAGSVCLVVALGCDSKGKKYILGFDVVDTESYESWKGFLVKLKIRTFTGTKLVISDAHAGLKRAIEEVFLGAAWQRCNFCLMKNVKAKINSRTKRKIACHLKNSI